MVCCSNYTSLFMRWFTSRNKDHVIKFAGHTNLFRDHQMTVVNRVKCAAY